jgi:predicted mannosyl-3-phosphoglycerate phosphatase (HAD superfamily)
MSLELESVSKEKLAEASPETPLETPEGKSADSWLFVERETSVNLLKGSSELINSTVGKRLRVDWLADELMIESASWALHDASANKDSLATLALKVIERLAERFVAEI